MPKKAIRHILQHRLAMAAGTIKMTAGFTMTHVLLPKIRG
jgi:hypothetical protein